MFRKILTFFVFGFVLLNVSSASAEIKNIDVFYKGNDFYSNAQYQEAIDMYKSIESNGFVSGELFYNMANAYLKLNNKGMAMLYYLRALRIMPRDADLSENIAFLSNLLVDKVASNSYNMFVEYVFNIRDFFSLEEFLKIIIFFYLVLMIVLSLWMFFPAYRKIFIMFSVVTGLCLLLFVGFYSLRYYDTNIVKKAVVLSPKVKLFYSPLVSDNPAFIVHEGLVVVIEKQDGDWMHVNIKASDMSGWIQKADVMVI